MSSSPSPRLAAISTSAPPRHTNPAHRVTLSEFKHELVEETTRWPTMMMHQSMPICWRRLGDDGTKELFRRLLEQALQELIDAELTTPDSGQLTTDGWRWTRGYGPSSTHPPR